MTIDSKKLAEMIELFVSSTNGHCVQAGAVIGVVGGRLVRLTVSVPDEEEELAVLDKWKCVTGKESP